MRHLKNLILPTVALGLAAAARPASDAPAGVSDWRETSARGTPGGTQTSPNISPTKAPTSP